MSRNATIVCIKGLASCRDLRPDLRASVALAGGGGPEMLHAFTRHVRDGVSPREAARRARLECHRGRSSDLGGPLR